MIEWVPVAAVIDLNAELLEEHGGAPGLRNRGALDGNKRAAFVNVGVFLHLNGLYLDATEKDAEEVISAIAAGSLTEESLAAWLRERCVSS